MLFWISKVRNATTRSEPFSYDGNVFGRNRNGQHTNAAISKPGKTVATISEGDVTVTKPNVWHPYRFAQKKPLAKAVVLIDLAVSRTADTWSDIVRPIFLPGIVELLDTNPDDGITTKSALPPDTLFFHCHYFHATMGESMLSSA